jgi:hypothetical protein
LSQPGNEYLETPENWDKGTSSFGQPTSCDSQEVAPVAAVTRDSAQRSSEYSSPLGEGRGQSDQSPPTGDRSSVSAGSGDELDDLEQLLRSAILQQNDETARQNMARLGLQIGTFYVGLIDAGVSAEPALRITSSYVYSVVQQGMDQARRDSHDGD